MLTSELTVKAFNGLMILLIGLAFIILCGVLSDHIAPRSKVLMRFVEWFAGSLEDEEFQNRYLLAKAAPVSCAVFFTILRRKRMISSTERPISQ